MAFIINMLCREYCEYLVRLKEGFRVGYNYQSHKCEQAKSNMKSAADNPEVVDHYLERGGARAGHKPGRAGGGIHGADQQLWGDPEEPPAEMEADS